MFRFVPFVMPASLRRLGLVVLACSAVALAGCGGGSRAKDYAPNSIVVFGDENSALTSASTTNGSSDIKGLVYSVNPLLAVNVLQVPYTVATDYASVYYCPGTVASVLCTNSTKYPTSNTAVFDVSTFPTTNPAAATYPIGVGYANPTGVTDPNNPSTSAPPNLVSFNYVGTATVNGAPGTSVVKNQYYQYPCTSGSNAALIIAHAFGFGFRNNADGNGCPNDLTNGQNYAAVNNKVADVQAMVASKLSTLGSGVLVVVWVGQNDVLEIFNGSTWPTLTQKINEAARRADVLASVLQSILNTGANLLVINVPEIGASPYALGSTATLGGGCVVSGSSCNGDLDQVVDAFNHTLIYGGRSRNLPYAGMSTYTNNGRQWGLVDAWQISQSYSANTSSYVNSAICDPNLVFKPDGSKPVTTDPTKSWVQYCTSSSLLSGSSTNTYLWADSLHLSGIGHGAIGTTAYNLAAKDF